ncbi:NBR1-Ig-like domain-containing protein [Saccharopolyspora rosea]|uniref:NBR1-Ig-like domain-containing protein n=1 Tax=Saccharopolyspora rosea TaxID=524884 RepID=A0ABW3FPI9_9PSEU|nr:NBR1-Ig-like domain-containing protein [Saccharopolyspora rosea]
MTIEHEVDQPRKRGRRARRPDPDDGPVAAFAHALLTLKESAGDPSYDRMRVEFGAMASKSALSAAARGDVLPSWETTWEFVRSLAVTGLGRDQQETRDVWRARWESARAAEESGRCDDEPTKTLPDRAPAPEVSRTARYWPLLVAAAAVVALVALVAHDYLGGGNSRNGTASQQSPPLPGDASRLDDDVTYPDGSAVAVNQRFTKTWRLTNTGTVAWHGRFLQRQPPLDGLDVCHTASRVPIPDTAPGASVLVSVPAQAPGAPGTCRVFWKMVDAQGRLFLPQYSGIYFDVTVTDGPAPGR